MTACMLLVAPQATVGALEPMAPPLYYCSFFMQTYMHTHIYKRAGLSCLSRQVHGRKHPLIHNDRARWRVPTL